jgi:exodeoxyribonuclease VII large subunit
MDQTVPIFQVSEFNELINRHLALLGEVIIEGELTRLDIKNGRLIFASIKDKTSSLDIFSMTHLIHNVRQLEPGMLVRVVGTAGVYKGTSKFRLMASSITPQGEGALQIAFEKLKQQLEAEGLFDPGRKRPLPKWPTNIALITAKDSSAYFDVVKILTTRMGGLTITLLPVNVQGRVALPTILSAFIYLNSHAKEFDCCIMARGGGSLTDLEAFNSEEIARAVFSSKVPVVSAIGHENNWSLTDYVADVRASTPSNAAELVVKEKREVENSINSALQFIKESLNYRLDRLTSVINESSHFILRYTAKIRQSIDHSLLVIRQQANLTLSLSKQDIDNTVRLLNSLDYRQILNRGFSITTLQSGTIIKQSSQVSSNDILITQLAQGKITSHVQ